MEELFSSAYKEIREKEFDALVKRALPREKINFLREESEYLEKEIPFCELENGIEETFSDDSFKRNFSDIYAQFNVLNQPITIEDEDLSEILSGFDKTTRNIILMYNVLKMNDERIAQKIGFKRRKVTYIRNNAETKIRKIMEEKKHDCIPRI